MHGTSLAAFSIFAELTAAIAIAYAGVTNFRYRSEVQAYVRELFEPELRQVIGQNPGVWNKGCWTILHKLGRLAELDAPSPTKLTQDDPESSFFLRSIAFRMYNLIYAS